jgi:hypothetical protein
MSSRDPLTPAAFLPRYASELSLLRHDQAHLRRAPAPAFWALTPFHVQQPDDCTCGSASVAVVLSALRAREGLAPPQVGHATVARLPGGPRPDGFTLEELADLTRRGLAIAGVRAEVAAIHADDPPDDPPAVAAAFRADLEALEAGRALLIANFAVAPLLGACEFGHHSPLGAYDASTDRVLVLDVYRQAFEPYWAPTSLLLAAMSLPDPASGRSRGYLRLLLP